MIRAFTFALLGCVSVFLIGCKEPEQSQPVWEQFKIGDIAPSRSDQQQVGKLLNTINFDVHIFEIPAESTGKLDDIWGLLYTEPLRFNSYKAFTANSFVVRFGRVRMWNRIHDLLRAAGGQKIVTVSLILTDGQADDLTVRGLNMEQRVSFVAANGRTEGVRQSCRVGPGILALRIKAEKISNLRDVCEFIACPVFTVPTRSSIPQLFVRAKAREFSFPSVTFGLRMAPGDFIVLGPEKYNPPTADKTTLDGLFFSKPEGSLFPSTTGRIAPELKPVVRIFLLVCAGISN
jgi:hypothetical protein